MNTSTQQHTYAIEKLTDAIRCLATHPGDVRSRLIAAHMCLHTLQERDFPQHLHADWKWINRQLTRRDPVLDYKGDVLVGSVETTMRSIQNRTGAKIAKKLYELYWAISSNTQYE
jgi:hypothetical protein